MKIKDYELVSTWKVACKGATAQAIKGGKKYFLKKYDICKKPKLEMSVSQDFYEKKNREFTDFVENRKAIIDTLKDMSGSGGNIILPSESFIDDVSYVEVSKYIDDLIEDEAILNLSKNEKNFLMLTIAAAIYNIHKKKIVHGDLKRTNILASRNDSGKTTAKIIDFDSSFFENNIRPDELSGDQAYMSPELAQCFISDMDDRALELMSNKTDIFSLGIVFYNYLVTEKYTSEGKKHIKGCYPEIKGLSGRLKERADAGKTIHCGEALLSGAHLVISKEIKEKYLRHLLAAMLQPNPEDRPTALEVLTVLREKKVLDLKSNSILIDGEIIEDEDEHYDKAMPSICLSAFCSTWPEHDIVFNETNIKNKGYISTERLEKFDKKLYYFVKSDGNKRIFNVENLILLGFASNLGKDKKATSKVEPSSSKSTTNIKIYDDGKLWESDYEYIVNKKLLNSSGYEKVVKAEKEGTKGYALIKFSGQQHFITFANLKLLKYVVKK